MQIEKIGLYLRNIELKKNGNLNDKIVLATLSRYRKVRDTFSKNDSRTISRLYLQTKCFERNITGGKYFFVTIDDLVVWTTEWIKSFPNCYDLIIGLPRSGLLIANIIGLKLGKPISTPELFCQANYWKSKVINTDDNFKNILLVDDSMDSGKTMEDSIRLIYSHYKNINITKAVLITTNDSKDLVDLYYKIIPQPRIFEWNLLHAKKGKVASDMDGVICENCPPGIDSDEDLYIDWIRNAKPYLIPSFEIDKIVSSRLERYRSETEEWLAQHKVHYGELILWNIGSKQERNGKNAQYKVEALLKIKPDMFWESSFYEAKQIWNATKIPTICLDDMTMFT